MESLVSLEEGKDTLTDKVQSALNRITHEYNAQQKHQEAIAAHRSLDKFDQEDKHKCYLQNLSNDYVKEVDGILKNLG